MARRTNGQGSIYRDKSTGRWVGAVVVGYHADGKPRRRKVVARTQTEVRRRLDDLKAAVEISPTLDAEPTVGRFLEIWLAEVLPGTVSAVTADQYADVVRLYLTPRLGRIRLRELTPRDVNAMLRDMEQPVPGAPESRSPAARRGRPNGYSATARRLARSVLRRALRHAQAERLLDRNPAQLSNAVAMGSTEGRSLEIDQARTLLDSLRGHEYEGVLVLLLTTGLRISEALGLTWSDVDVDSSSPTLRVRQSLKRARKQWLLTAPKSARSRRSVSLPPRTIEALRVHRARQAAARLARGPSWIAQPLGADLVFRSVTGNVLQGRTVARELSEATTACGLGHWTPHAMRHSAASILIASGVPIQDVSQWLGHSGVGITSQVYAHQLSERREAVAAAMDRALSGP